VERNTCLHTRPFSPPASDFSGGNTPVYARIFCSFLRIFFSSEKEKKRTRGEAEKGTSFDTDWTNWLASWLKNI